MLELRRLCSGLVVDMAGAGSGVSCAEVDKSEEKNNDNVEI